MRGHLLSLIFVLFAVTQVYSQDDRQDMMQRVRAEKIAYITEKIGLEPDEAQYFWPVYNDFQKKKKDYSAEKKRILNGEGAAATANPSDKANRYIQIEKEEAQLAEIYHLKFIQIISADKTLKLYKAEEDFKVYLLRKLKAEE